MKLYALLLTLLAAQAQAQSPGPTFAMSCKHGSGYYGNIEAHTRSDGAIEVMAAQGFSYDLSDQLNWVISNHAMSQLTFLISPSKCQFNPANGKILTCRTEDALVTALDSNSQPFQFKAEIDLNVIRAFDYNLPVHIVTLGLHPIDSFTMGRVSHKFRTGMTYEGCHFRN